MAQPAEDISKLRESRGEEVPRIIGKRGERSPLAKKSLQLDRADLNPYHALSPEQKRQLVGSDFEL